MGRVRLLPEHVANQIAAGEVIERPAAVIKELVENALDAGATRIEVEYRHGGRSLMRVEDNGAGMSREDAQLAVQRHATSKLSEADDLNRLDTFGFRGEALPSIASVSYFVLQTRLAGEDEGTEIVYNGGKLVHVRDCGRAKGTRIEVTHLFNSVPARRKFLKTDTTEAAHIVQTVRLYALAFPTVAFTLFEGGRVIFQSPECRDLRSRVAEIFGRQTAADLVEIEATEGDMRVSGLIGRPAQGRGNRHEMISFINQRPVDSRTLNYALIESYQEWLPKGRYPVAFLFFSIDPAAVDVNVHPAKREVRFRNEPIVRSFVIRSLLGRLRELGVASLAAPVAVPVLPTQGAWPVSHSPSILPTPGPRSPWATPPSSHSVIKPASETSSSDGQVSGATSTTPVPAPSPSAPPSTPAVARHWRSLGVAHGHCAVFETPSGVVLLDRRSAHERIWFEKILREFQAGPVASQRLLLAVPLELDAVASAVLLERLEFFREHGFEIAEFGRQFFRIEAVPLWMEPLDAESFIRDLVAALRDGRLQGQTQALARDELARLAAAKAVRLPEQIGEAELRHLVTQLFQCENPLFSPSGRATFFELTHGELTRRFHRA